jgi:hypothetical protein
VATIATILFPDEPAAFDIDAQPETITSDGNEDVFFNRAQMGLWVKNEQGVAIDVTIVAQSECNNEVLHTVEVSVLDGFEGFIAKELQSSRFNDASQRVHLNYSAAGLRVAAVRLGD